VAMDPRRPRHRDVASGLPGKLIFLTELERMCQYAAKIRATVLGAL
jgi:hypothetical protein